MPKLNNSKTNDIIGGSFFSGFIYGYCYYHIIKELFEPKKSDIKQEQKKEVQIGSDEFNRIFNIVQQDIKTVEFKKYMADNFDRIIEEEELKLTTDSNIRKLSDAYKVCILTEEKDLCDNILHHNKYETRN